MYSKYLLLMSQEHSNGCQKFSIRQKLTCGIPFTFMYK